MHGSESDQIPQQIKVPKNGSDSGKLLHQSVSLHRSVMLIIGS